LSFALILIYPPSASLLPAQQITVHKKESTRSKDALGGYIRMSAKLKDAGSRVAVMPVAISPYSRPMIPTLSITWVFSPFPLSAKLKEVEAFGRLAPLSENHTLLQSV
jgi:hypothetical protein